MRRLLLTCLFLAAFAGGRGADDAGTDLGEGLSYLRLARLDGRPPPPTDRPLVLDLRRTQTTGGPDIDGLLESLRTPGALRLVLVSRLTAPVLLDRLETRAPGVLLLGTGLDKPVLDLSLPVSSEDDLRAYDAHDQGTDIARLIQPPLNKPRRDEAAIIRSRANGGANEPARTSDPEEDALVESATGEPVEPLLVDTVLQRAVHLHRGLKALGRL